MVSSASIAQEAKQANLHVQQLRNYLGSVSGHSAVFFLGTIFNALAAYGFKVYLARALGARLLGIYALGMTIVGVAGIFNTLGISQAAVRFVSSYTATQKFDQLRGFLGRGILLLLACNGVLAVVMLLVGPFVAVRFYHTPELSQYLGLFALVMVLGVFTSFFAHVLAGYKDVARRTVINHFIGTPATIFIAVALIASGMALKGYILAQIASASVVLILSATLVWRLTPKAARPFSSALAPLEKEVISVSAATLGMALLGFVMSHADLVVLGRYRDVSELGVYALASAVVAFVCIILTSVNQIFGPIIADLYARGQTELLSRMYQTLTKWILILTLPLASAIMIFAKPIMGIFGKDFEMGWVVLVVGTVGQLVNVGVGSSGTILYMTGRHRYLVGIQVVIAFMIIVLNFSLVPKWGIVGAILVAALANILANLSYLLAVHRTLGLFPYNSSYYRLFLPVTAMLFLQLIIRGAFASVWPAWLVTGTALLTGYLVFAAILLILGFSEDDKVLVEAIFARAHRTISRTEVNP
jgi:O-antigen/teichoic acid export membrane protein